MALTISASGICPATTWARRLPGVEGVPAWRMRMEVTPATATTAAIAIATFWLFLIPVTTQAACHLLALDNHWPSTYCIRYLIHKYGGCDEEDFAGSDRRCVSAFRWRRLSTDRPRTRSLDLQRHEQLAYRSI